MSIKNNYLLIHGWGGTRNSLQKLAENLYEFKETGNVEITELPGFGFTPLEKEYNLDDYLDYINKIILQLNEDSKKSDRLILVGHSVGGKILLRGLEKSDIDSHINIVLINASGLPLPKTLKRKLVYFFAKIAFPLKFFLLKLNLDVVFKYIQKAFYKFFVGARDYEKLNDKPALRQTFKNIVSDNIDLSKLEGVKNNILLIWGKLDTATPVWMAEKYKAVLKNSHLEVIEDGKHGLPLFQPELTARIINNYFKRIEN